MVLRREQTCVEGDPNQIDSFIACLVAVLHAWDRPSSYDWVAGLAGVAFSPVLDHGEECTAWWMESGSESRIGFLGCSLGFTVDRVTRETPWDDAAREAFATTGLLPQPHERHFARLRAAYDRGDAVLLRTWPAWSVLTGWSQDLDDLPFSTVLGFEDLVKTIWGPAQAQLAFLLNPIAPCSPLEKILASALRVGAKIARGRGPEEGLDYGAALYTAAAARMYEVEFCPSCGTAGDSCAHRTLMRMLGTQRSAVGFLEDARELVGDGLPWDAAINVFEIMAEVTVGYCDWTEFHDRWPDYAFRAELGRDLHTLAALQRQAADALTELSASCDRQLAT
ncbi:MAG: hypothetical protein JXC32_22000 [Anaerolineae bacterium]|nr:hypothetical protein [Anaerolineae bacterium]